MLKQKDVPQSISGRDELDKDELGKDELDNVLAVTTVCGRDKLRPKDKGEER